MTTTPAPTPSGAAAHDRWTNKQLLLEAEAIVVGRCGIDTVYAHLKSMRDEFRARIDELAVALTIEQAQTAELREQLDAARGVTWLPIEDGIHWDAAHVRAVVVKGKTLRTTWDFNRGAEVELAEGVALCRLQPASAGSEGTMTPTIVCLCGSTRFWRQFQVSGLEETLAGKIVLSIGSASGTDDEHFGHLSKEDHDRIVEQLNELHRRKIDMADEVLILNVDGYVGLHTQAELDYARELGKPVRFLEPEQQRPSAQDGG